MIAVVADDFTGAAELAAVAIRYGLSAEVQTVVNSDSTADILVIDTDTRSGTPQQAATEVKNVLEQLQVVGPEWVYKKVDSVLRGAVLAELEAVLAFFRKDRALLVPANPAFGRTIQHGQYFVNGKPLDKTAFANDPEHPAVSSGVLTILGRPPSLPACLLDPKQAIPARGIVVGEAASKADLTVWAKRCNHLTVPAGAAEFFAAILETKGFRLRATEDRHESDHGKTTLFVCGGGSYYNRKTVEQAQSRGVPVLKMPPELFQSDNPTDELFQHWTDDTVTALEQHSRVIVSINQPIIASPQLPQKLRRYTAALVENVLNRTTVDELYIEGGATASAVVRRLQWTRFSPCWEFTPGVVRMRVEEKQHQYLTVKPGSYPWPEKIWRLT